MHTKVMTVYAKLVAKAGYKNVAISYEITASHHKTKE